jgi:hypothetical protein
MKTDQIFQSTRNTVCEVYYNLNDNGEKAILYIQKVEFYQNWILPYCNSTIWFISGSFL